MKTNKIVEQPIENKLNKYNNYDIENADTKCPVCGKLRFWLKFYCNETILRCEDCGHFEKI